MSKANNRPKWIFTLFIICLVTLVISSAGFYFYIKTKAKKANLAFPSQMADSFRSAFGIEFVKWLEKSLHNFNDTRKRFLYTLFGEKVQARKINASETANMLVTNTQGKPIDIKPYLSGTPVPNEGKWLHQNMPKSEGKPIIYKTRLRVDPKRPFCILEIASIDINMVKFHLVAGSKYYGLRGKKGAGHIHYLDRNKLVASMNGGFLPQHRSGGMIIKSKEFIRMIPGKATLIFYKNGNVEITVWKRKMKRKIDSILHARQNLNILLKNGRFNRRATYWGIVKKGEDAVHNWRSGVGLTKDRKRLIYIAGNAVSPKSLALAFKLVGCDVAMHMDMNISNIAFNVYRHRDGDVQPISLSERFWQHMIGAYINGYTHDFIYMTKK